MTDQSVTEGISVNVQPRFSLARSAPEEGRFVFTYRIRMENHGDEMAQLLFRSWLIHDSIGEDTEVEGEGVVGEQPLLTPGRTHEYRSFCVLQSPVGYMEGHYTFERPDGSRFKVPVPRFGLEAFLPTDDGGEVH